MMRHLRPRRIEHIQTAQPRSHRLAVIRWVYLIGLAVFIVWGANFLFGSLFYLRSDGLVLGEPTVVAAEFPATVHRLAVRDGDRVTAGQIVASVTSQSVAETIARLSSDVAARQARLSELRVRGQLVDAMIALAENRQSVATSTRQEFETLLSRGFLTLDKRVSALEGEYRSHHDVETLKAERRVVESETDTLTTALAEAQSALRDLKRLFDDGHLRAKIDGLVTRLVADKGAVVRPGDPVMEIYDDDLYVLAYVPTGGIFSVAVGDEVAIVSGLQRMRGTVSRIEPYAAALPREFQRAFTPTERQQVIRVRFAPGEERPPLFTKVQVRSAGIGSNGWLSRLWQIAFTPSRSGA